MANQSGKRGTIACVFLLFFLVLAWWELSYNSGAKQIQKWQPLKWVTDNEAVQRNETKKTSAKKSLYNFKPRKQSFVGSVEDIQPFSYRLLAPIPILQSAETFCKDRPEKCEVYNSFVKVAKTRASSADDVRIYMIPIDPLALLKTTDMETYMELAESLVDDFSGDRFYMRYGGSDHIFVCLTIECQQFGADFAPRLAENKGTRAIFAGVHLDEENLKWPCPYRVIQINKQNLEDMNTLVDTVTTKAAFMIEKANRWVCSDKRHPEHYFGKHTEFMSSGGAYMKEFRFHMCCNAKSGSTMMRMMLRRLMHKEDYLATGSGVVHGSKSGIKYVNNRKNFDLMKAIYDEPYIIKGIVVRHPFTRLLSGYLDKIDSGKRYNSINGLSEFVKVHGHPSFSQFVDLLVGRFRQPPPNMDQHFRSQSVECGGRDHRYDFVGRIENLADEFKEFSQSLGFWEDYVASGWGVNQTQPFGERSYQRNQHHALEQLREFYTEDIVKKVRQFYKDDFETFGFTVAEVMNG